MDIFAVVNIAMLLVSFFPGKLFGSHFRGGSISWKPTGNGREVIFNVKTGWVYSECGTNIGSSGPGVSLTCQSGCNGTITPSNSNNTCLAADKQQDWSRAELVFRYTFTGDGPFTVAFTGGAWITEVGGSNWNVSTTVYLAPRSDTREPNNSPVAASKPIYYVKYGCTGNIVIPVTDADGDTIRCRWSKAPECSSVCYSPSFLPDVDLDEDSCTIRVKAINKTGGKYAVAMTIEDRPKSTITIGGKTFTPNDVISSTPMQFIFITPNIIGRGCCDKPVFVKPTPLEIDLLVCVAGTTISIPLYATSSNTVIKSFLGIDPPSDMTQSTIAQDVSRTDVFFTTLTWTPKPEDQGIRKLCVEATDSYLLSTQRCLTISAWDVGPCVSEPCFNNGTCTRVGVTDDFQCACQPGYTSRQCHIDIDECASNPCQNGGTCIDQVNGYKCVCFQGYTDLECQTDIDECASNPCQNGGTCIDQVNGYQCDCVPGYTDLDCQTDIDECASNPCLHGGTCVDQVNMYQCMCVPGYTDLNCQIDIDECASGPCQHGGTCEDQVNMYQCVCAPGYTDLHCETDINECASNPCDNGATCFDMIDEWFCGCMDGYTGISCETDINECQTQSCENGGTCRDLVGSSVCDCIPGTYGTICQNGMNHCLSLPCENHGRCINTNGSTGYMCDCVDGWQGRHCAYRFENASLGTNTAMLKRYMHYSDCNCKMGNDHQDRCFMYTDGKNAGFGVLGAILGVTTSILLYIIYIFLIHTCDVDDIPMLYKKHTTVKSMPEEKPETNPEGEPNNAVEVVEEKPKGRQHKCWACDVKRNMSEAPNWYRQEDRHYRAYKQSKIKRIEI